MDFQTLIDQLLQTPTFLPIVMAALMWLVLRNISDERVAELRAAAQETETWIDDAAVGILDALDPDDATAPIPSPGIQPGGSMPITPDQGLAVVDSFHEEDPQQFINWHKANYEPKYIRVPQGWTYIDEARNYWDVDGDHNYVTPITAEVRDGMWIANISQIAGKWILKRTQNIHFIAGTRVECRIHYIADVSVNPDCSGDPMGQWLQLLAYHNHNRMPNVRAAHLTHWPVTQNGEHIARFYFVATGGQDIIEIAIRALWACPWMDSTVGIKSVAFVPETTAQKNAA